MSQADDENQRVIEQYAQLKRRMSRFVFLLGISAIAMIFTAVAVSDPDSGHLFGLPVGWVIWGGMVLAGLIGTAFSLEYWRCPACGKYMGGVWFMRHCPRCGVLLRR
jgi:hypothetical protein